MTVRRCVIRVRLLAAVAALSGCTGAVATRPPTPELASPGEVPDSRPVGARAFDFFNGTWLVRNRVLAQRLVGSTTWREWDALMDVVPILRGYGSMDRFRPVSGSGGFEGMTIRLYDADSGEWEIYWLDTTQPTVRRQVRGRMATEGGEFFGVEAFGDRQVPLRFRWRVTGDSVTWDQSYGTQDGRWEINWMMTFLPR